MKDLGLIPKEIEGNKDRNQMELDIIQEDEEKRKQE